MSATKPNRRLAGVNAAADYMGGLSPWTLRSWAYSGRVSSFKIGTRLMFDLDELDAVIAQSERPRLEAAK